MIKFFQKIRYDLIAKNPPAGGSGNTGKPAFAAGKYLKYAIGEIMLVVIGILLAVSIGTWNKQRNLVKSNEVYLLNLLEELNSNINRLNFLAFSNSDGKLSLDSVVKNCLYITPRFSKGLEESDYEFLINNSVFLGSSQLNLNDATYEELLNTGKLYSLGSDSLTKAVKGYYKRYEREIYYNEMWKDEAFRGFELYEQAMLRLYADHEFSPETFKVSNYSWVFDKNSKKYMDLQLGISKLLISQAQDLEKCISLKEDTNKLIEIIKKELKANY
jgi:hypothetical protein